MRRNPTSAPILLLFVDGVGLAPAGPHNPLAQVGPGFGRLLAGPLTMESVGRDSSAQLTAIDACLGVPGLPQSATGQTALFTGVNAPMAIGRHVVAFPGPRLRRILHDHGMLARARRSGLSCVFANAFTSRYFELVERRRLRKSASVVMAESAGLALRGTAELRAGDALTWDLCRDLFARSDDDRVATITAHEAGRHLHRIATRHDVTLFETFLTDLAGHGRGPLDAVEAVRRIDALVAGLLEAADGRLTVVLTSDHGNLEESHHRRHTRNPVPLLCWGPHASRFAAARALTDVADAVLEVAAAGCGRSIVRARGMGVDAKP